MPIILADVNSPQPGRSVREIENRLFTRVSPELAIIGRETAFGRFDLPRRIVSARADKDGVTSRADRHRLLRCGEGSIRYAGVCIVAGGDRKSTRLNSS